MVLLLGLLFLIALTLLGLSAAADTVLQSQLASNLEDTERTRQAALMTLRQAERWLISLQGSPPATCTLACGGLILHPPGSLPLQPEFMDTSWWQDNGQPLGTDPLTRAKAIPGVSSDVQTPIWVIEVLHETPPDATGSTNLRVWYRILARTDSRSGKAVSVMESTVVRNWATKPGPAFPLPSKVVAGPCQSSAAAEYCGRLAWRQLR